METGSYLLAGSEERAEAFLHDSARERPYDEPPPGEKDGQRTKLQREMEGRGIYVRTASWGGLAEEAGTAYKNIDDVVEATELAGLSKRVVRLLPVGNIKG